MFDILGKRDGLRVVTSDAETLRAVETVKNSAESVMAAYDVLSALPTQTKEQLQFIKNNRESFEGVVETASALSVLFYLKSVCLDSEKDPYVLMNLQARLRKTVDKTVMASAGAIRLASEDVKKLASEGRVRLNGRPASSLSGQDTDLNDDGFAFQEDDGYFGLMAKVSLFGKEYAGLVSRSFLRGGLSPEQEAYHGFEKRVLIILIKELFRSAKYVSNNRAETYHTVADAAGVIAGTADILRSNAELRLDAALDIVKRLADRGCLTVQE